MDNEYIERVKAALGGVLSRIRSASDGKDTELLLATKTVPVEVINHVAENFGVTLIGENKAQELLEKYDALDRERLKVHFIGHLQKNKVKYIIDKVDMIQSVDSTELAEEISKRAKAIGRVMPVLIEINIAREADKGGVYPENAIKLVREVSLLEGVAVKGLMTMAPAKITSEEYTRYFSETKKIFDEIKTLDIEGVEMKTLSMGMSESYVEAVKCGATLVRIGSAVFGKRAYPEKI